MTAFLPMVAAALAAGLAFAPSAGAQTAGTPPAERPTPMFKALDADGNGTLTLEEFLKGPRGEATPSSPDSRQHLETRFRQMDADGDGALTPGELIGSGRRPPPQQR